MALKGIGLNGKAEIHMRKLKMWLLGLAAAAMLSVSACAQEIPEGSLNGNGSVSAEKNQAESADENSQAVSSSENGGNRVSSASGTSFNLADVPAYSGQPYVAVNGNVPYFTDADLTDVSFESYSDLDSLGRCGVAYASVSQDTMPTEKRGSIGEVKPTGWHTAKYDNVDGKYLYNRCHLIGYQLTAENANVKNLITGTRYLNVQGMLPFENLTADYVKETGNHVMYRVTPVFEGDNLVASGVLMEAESVEDQGEGVLFCVYVYNVQPGIAIDYATGESWADGSGSAGSTAGQGTAGNGSSQNQSAGSGAAGSSGGGAGSSGSSATVQTYILNTNSKKFHLPSCTSVTQMKVHVLDNLHEKFGVDVSDKAIRKAVKEHNEVCKILTEIGELRKAENPVITGYEYHILNLVSFTCPKRLILPYLKETLKEIKARKPDPKPWYRARVAMVGSEIDDPSLTKLFEDCGAFICSDRYCFGSTPGREVIELNNEEDALTQICRHVMEHSECARYISDEKVHQRRETADRLAKEFGAEGIIYEQMKYCDYWGF